MPANINGTTGFGGNLTGNVTGNVTGTASAIANGAVSAAKLDGAQTGSAPIYGCRAWVFFNGTKDTTGATSTGNTDRQVLASGNVTRVTRNAIGVYTLFFTLGIQDLNYAAFASCNPVSASARNFNVGPTSRGIGQLTVALEGSDGNAGDQDNISVCVFR